jgi:hypothetical protein
MKGRVFFGDDVATAGEDDLASAPPAITPADAPADAPANAPADAPADAPANAPADAPYPEGGSNGRGPLPAPMERSTTSNVKGKLPAKFAREKSAPRMLTYDFGAYVSASLASRAVAQRSAALPRLSHASRAVAQRSAALPRLGPVSDVCLAGTATRRAK